MRKFPVLSIEIFRSLVLSGMRYYNPLLSNFRSIICPRTGRLREVEKTKENITYLALKVVAVTYWRWSHTRGFKYSDLSWKILVFWKTVGRWEWPLTRDDRSRGSTVACLEMRTLVCLHVAHACKAHLTIFTCKIPYISGPKEGLNVQWNQSSFKLTPKVDDIKIKSTVSALFLPLPVYLPFIAVLSLLFARLQGPRKAFKFSEIKVQLNSRGRYLPFIALLSLLFARLQGLKKAYKF